MNVNNNNYVLREKTSKLKQQEPEQAPKEVPTYLGRLKPHGMPKENTHVNRNNLMMYIDRKPNKQE